MKCSLSMSGFKDLENDFKLLSDVEQRQVSKKAVRAASVVFRDAVKESTPIRTGKLKRAVSVAAIKGKEAIAGVTFKKVRVIRKLKHGEGSVVKRWTPFWWWFLENGSSNMAPKPFVRPAFDQNIDKAEKAGFAQYEQDINRIFAK